MYVSLVFVLIINLLGFGAPIPVEEKDFGDKLLALVQTLHNNCVAKSGVKEATIDTVKKGNFVEDPKVKNYVTCVLMDTTVIDEQGVLNMGMVKELCPPKIKNKAPKILEDCYKKNLANKNLDDRNYKILNCVYDTDKESFIMF